MLYLYGNVLLALWEILIKVKNFITKFRGNSCEAYLSMCKNNPSCRCAPRNCTHNVRVCIVYAWCILLDHVTYRVVKKKVYPFLINYFTPLKLTFYIYFAFPWIGDNSAYVVKNSMSFIIYLTSYVTLKLSCAKQVLSTKCWYL